MNSKLSKFLACFVLAAVLFISGCTQQEQTPPAATEGTGTPSTGGLSACLTIIDETKLPSSLGGFTGMPVKTTEPFSWTGPDDVKKSMPSTGYMSIYTSGSKFITAAIQKLQTSDYNTIVSDAETTKSRDEEGIVKVISVKGSTTYIIDYSSEGSVIWYIFAGDDIFVVFAFSGTTFEESQNWINAWTNTVC